MFGIWYCDDLHSICAFHVLLTTFTLGNSIQIRFIEWYHVVVIVCGLSCMCHCSSECIVMVLAGGRHRLAEANHVVKSGGWICFPALGPPSLSSTTMSYAKRDEDSGKCQPFSTRESAWETTMGDPTAIINNVTTKKRALFGLMVFVGPCNAFADEQDGRGWTTRYSIYEKRQGHSWYI